MKKRMMALILAICLAAGLPGTAAFADQPLYVALGDSIAAGYGLEGYQDVSGAAGNLVFTVPEECFPKLIAADKGYSLQNLAVSGDDTTDLLSRLRTGQYSDALKQADLISLTIGSNDLLKKVLNLIMEKYMPGSTDHSLLATPGQDGLLTGDMSQMLATLKSVNDYLNSEEVRLVLEASVAAFKVNWDLIVDTLAAWNPDAQIIVTNYYNPFSALNFALLNLNVGTLAQGYLNQMNAYISTNSRCGSKYAVVDVTETTTNVKLDTAALVSAFFGTAVDLSQAVNLDPHPDAAGHIYFARQIETELNSADQPGTKQTQAFSDVAADIWYAVPVGFAATQGLVVGDEAGLFHPGDKMTLAQYMTVLYRFARKAAPEAIPERATTGANWMEAAAYVNTEMMSGAYTDLSQDMSRAQMADITAATLKRIAAVTGKVPNTRETHGFSDVTGNDAVLYLESIYGVDGYLQEDGSYLFRGENPISRAEVAQVVYNIMTKSIT